MNKQTNTKPWFKKWYIVTFFVCSALILFVSIVGNNNSSKKQDAQSKIIQDIQEESKIEPVTEKAQAEVVAIDELKKVEPVTTTQEDNKLLHDELLKISKDNSASIIGRSFQMTLYLEQQQSNTQAEFMTQQDDNSMDTILITCNMTPKDLEKLDGDSAQKRIYKPYTLFVTFSEYDQNVDLYYKADCVLHD